VPGTDGKRVCKMAPVETLLLCQLRIAFAFGGFAAGKRLVVDRRPALFHLSDLFNFFGRDRVEWKRKQRYSAPRLAL